MTKTRRQLVNQACKNLLNLPAGQSPNADDYESVDGFVDGLIRRLSSRDIIDVGDADAIEPDVFDPLAVLLADAAKAEFGGGEFDVMKAERDLREISAAEPTYAILKTDYF